MKDFLIRSFCLAAVILILAGYNQVLKDRSKDEEITKLEVQVTKLQAGKRKNCRYKRNLSGRQMGRRGKRFWRNDHRACDRGKWNNQRN